MVVASSIRATWLAQLFSTEPADRPRAEAAVRDLYLAAGLAGPRYFVWFDSPFEAAWAVAVLLEPHDWLWRQILTQAARSTSERGTMDRIRRLLRQRILEVDWPGAVNAMGRSLTGAEEEGKSLAGEIFAARVGLYPGLDGRRWALHSSSDEDDLYRAEGHLWGTERGVLATQASCATLISASFLNLYSYSAMAADEARCTERKPPRILAAAWEVARSAGPWWPFEHAAILTDRPSEIHINERGLLHCGDGPAAVYRDGARVYAWGGQSMPEDWILHPERIPPGQLRRASSGFGQYVLERSGGKAVAVPKVRPSKILRAKLPLDHEKRLQKLRAYAGGTLPYLQRYLDGEHEKVWADLIALGPVVRRDPHAADALAVAYETMRRVLANLITVIGRLHDMGYIFKTDGIPCNRIGHLPEHFLDLPSQNFEDFDLLSLPREVFAFHDGARGPRTQRARKPAPADGELRAWVPPGPRVLEQVRRIQKDIGPMPLSLRAFYEVVGSVDLIGYHETLAPGPSQEEGQFCPDPLVVFALDELLAEGDAEVTEQGAIPISPDHLHKADSSGGAPYEVAIPDVRADGELLNERHNLFFVDYLRLAFRYGGFPGYDGIDRGVPEEIETLCQGLLPF